MLSIGFLHGDDEKWEGGHLSQRWKFLTMESERKSNKEKKKLLKEGLDFFREFCFSLIMSLPRRPWAVLVGITSESRYSWMVLRVHAI